MTGTINYNNFGSKMKIIAYRNCEDIDIYFEEYNYIAKHKRYDVFKNGEITCPYEPRVLGVGYIGEGKYSKKNDELAYRKWYQMLKRCYDEKYQNKKPTYKGCFVCKEWHNFQNFAEWFYKNYYKITGEIMCLDKDILIKGNKIYSPKTCCIVPNTINCLFTKCDKNRGSLPIGVTFCEERNKYVATCSVFDFSIRKKKNRQIGYFNTLSEAFLAYKNKKEFEIKKHAEYYKEHIPYDVYVALYNYQVEIND